MSKKEKNNIIHIIRDEIKTVRDEMKTVQDDVKFLHRKIDETTKWIIGTMVGAIVLIGIGAVSGLGWVHNYHLKKDNTMSVDIVKNEKEIQEVKAEVKALAQK